MNNSYIPLHYIEPLFRPPSEANSLILQVTNGCSWNHCAFCEMYTAPQKKFSTKTLENIQSDIDEAAQQYPDTRRIFLADGDAMVLSTRRLLEILDYIKLRFPEINRVSSYCLPRNVSKKSPGELREIYDAGLKLVYVGAESGDDELLGRINKGETLASSVDALNKIHTAGIKSSVMILNGLGGQDYCEQHALNSAKLVNAAQPNYLATLVVSFPMGKERFLRHFEAGFSFLDQAGLFREMEIFLENTQLENTIFRSDHASNYLVLKGVLGRDKNKLLEKLRQAQQFPDSVHLREEWQ
ncbi:MAG: radical SAM protein, partial [Gammaproteobacteria bacterium]|nr:radical SAM protein [Gammaproteobacteria bacterium]